MPEEPHHAPSRPPFVEPTAADWVYLEGRRRRAKAWTQRQRPKSMATVVGQLMIRRGYGRVQSAGSLAAAWSEVAGELVAGHTRVGAIRRGVLAVTVANSTLMQELVFQKPALVAKLSGRCPELKLRDMRFRIGPVE